MLNIYHELLEYLSKLPANQKHYDIKSFFQKHHDFNMNESPDQERAYDIVLRLHNFGLVEKDFDHVPSEGKNMPVAITMKGFDYVIDKQKEIRQLASQLQTNQSIATTNYSIQRLNITTKRNYSQQLRISKNYLLVSGFVAFVSILTLFVTIGVNSYQMKLQLNNKDTLSLWQAQSIDSLGRSLKMIDRSLDSLLHQ